MTNLEKLEELKAKFEKQSKVVESLRRGINRIENMAIFLDAVDVANESRHRANCGRDEEGEGYDEELNIWRIDVVRKKERLERDKTGFESELKDEIKARDEVLREYMTLAYLLNMPERVTELIGSAGGYSTADWFADKEEKGVLKVAFEDDVFENPVREIKEAVA